MGLYIPQQQDIITPQRNVMMNSDFKNEAA